MAVSRPTREGHRRRETRGHELFNQGDVLYPNETFGRLALRGNAPYQLSWSDANVWAHTEHYALDTFGMVRVVDPFV